jgi:hypothetical protein
MTMEGQGDLITSAGSAGVGGVEEGRSKSTYSLCTFAGPAHHTEPSRVREATQY